MSVSSSITGGRFSSAASASIFYVLRSGAKIRVKCLFSKSIYVHSLYPREYQDGNKTLVYDVGKREANERALLILGSIGNTRDCRRTRGNSFGNRKLKIVEFLIPSPQVRWKTMCDIEYKYKPILISFIDCKMCTYLQYVISSPPSSVRLRSSYTIFPV